jgi:demethylmenaquinone methyltransferase / 2-methoxy-6-polyprenyl-1,4-benzoquinol methylase
VQAFAPTLNDVYKNPRGKLLAAGGQLFAFNFQLLTFDFLATHHSPLATMPSNSPALGSRPPGATSESDAAQKVRKMFTDIAPTYDSLNHILSINIDKRWRARTAKLLRPILQCEGALVLDLCCGTGDLALAMRKVVATRVMGAAKIIAADFAHTMLVRARLKSARVPSHSGLPSNILPVVEADALRLPFADQTFDLVTTAFGFRNLANYEAGLLEIHRILKPGGTIAILEFTEPPDTLLGSLYRWYFRRVLPRIGAWLSGDADAYTYLPKSVSRFFQPAELSGLLTSTGYQSPTFRRWTLGTVALHTAHRPS